MADWPPAQVAARVAEIIRHHLEKYDQVVWLETSAAQQALGLSDLEAAWLFSSYRERTEVLAALDELAAGHRPELPDDDEDNEDA